MADKVFWEKTDKIAVIAFKQATIDSGFILDFYSVIDEIEKDDEVRVVVIKGAEGKIFFAGYDIGLILSGDAAETSRLSGKTLEVQQLMNRVEHCFKPIIGVVDGYAVGGGCEMILACDMVYASERAIFGTPEVKIGLIPAAGGTIRLPREVGKHKAMEMILTGKMYTAIQARDMGIVNEVFNYEELWDKAMKTANMIAKNAPIAVKAAKASVVESMTLLDKQIELFTVEENVKCLESSDIKEGAEAFTQNRKPNFQGK